jgi:hypothetical protein
MRNFSRANVPKGFPSVAFHSVSMSAAREFNIWALTARPSLRVYPPGRCFRRSTKAAILDLLPDMPMNRSQAPNPVITARFKDL